MRSCIPDRNKSMQKKIRRDENLRQVPSRRIFFCRILKESSGL